MEQEIVKLLNVLRRVGRAARYAEWARSDADAIQFCVAQYNRILARLGELEPAIKPLFAPLNDSASPEVIRMASRELLAYFEVEEPLCVPIIPPIPPLPPVFRFGRRRRRPRIRWAPFWIKCD